MNSNGFLGWLGSLARVMAAVVIGVIMKGWVMSILWSWFIVTTFKAPKLDIIPAIGIWLIISFTTPTVTSKRDDSRKGDEERSADAAQSFPEKRDDSFKENAKMFTELILFPLVILLYGYILHKFM